MTHCVTFHCLYLSLVSPNNYGLRWPFIGSDVIKTWSFAGSETCGTLWYHSCVCMCACVVVSSDKHVVSFGQMEPSVINKVKCHQVSSIAD